MSTPNPPVDRPDASARVLAALVAVALLPGMLAVELYVWRYETESPEIVARVLVLAAAVAGFVLFAETRHGRSLARSDCSRAC